MRAAAHKTAPEVRHMQLGALPLRRRRCNLQLLLIIAAVVSCKVPLGGQEQLSPAGKAKINDAAGRVISSGRSAGIALAIAHNGRIMFASGYGLANLEDGTRVQADTVFRIGSVTKQFTAAAIMILAEQGKLSVNDKLGKFFPSFPRGNEVTIRELLTHTSGIHDYLDAEYFRTTMRLDKTTTQFVDLIEKQTPLYDFDPGTHWNYSNSGYYLLSVIVEQASGMSFHDFMQQTIFNKLRMNETAVDDASEIVVNRASGYDADSSHPGRFRNAAFISLTTVGGAGAIRSSVKDLVRWHDALWNGELLQRSALAEMISPARLTNGQLARQAIFAPPASANDPPPRDFSGQDYGYGLRIKPLDGFERIGHGGDISGFSAQVDTFPKLHLTIAMLSNTSNGLSLEIERTALHVALEVLPTESGKPGK